MTERACMPLECVEQTVPTTCKLFFDFRFSFFFFRFLRFIFYNKLEGEVQRFPTKPLFPNMYSVPHYQHHYHQHHWNGALVTKHAPTLTL